MNYRLLKPNSCVLGFFLVLLFLLNSNLAFAQNDTYAINDVIANGSGKSPTQARNNATVAAQRNAFLILLDRLAIDPNVASTIDDSSISDMVASQQILNEKISGNNYSATLNLTFSESFVKHYLGKKIAATDEPKDTAKPTNASSYLIIPVKLLKNQSLIWETNNDWKIAWENILKTIKVPNLKLAKGDIDDIAIISPTNVENPNFTDFEPILSKYRVDGLMLVYFDFDSIENKVNIILQNVQKFNSTQTKLDFVNVNQLSPEDLVAKVAEKTFNYITSTNDKLAPAISTAQSSQPLQQAISTYQIDVLISSLDDWLKVKNKLENSNLVSQFKVDAISREMVKINVSYNNNNGEIINFFARNNLFLQKKTEGGYFLSLNKIQ